MNSKSVWILTTLAALLIAAPAVADIVLYQQNFDGYSDGTLLTAVPSWYSYGTYAPPRLSAAECKPP